MKVRGNDIDIFLPSGKRSTFAFSLMSLYYNEQEESETVLSDLVLSTKVTSERKPDKISHMMVTKLQKKEGGHVVFFVVDNNPMEK